MADSLEETFGAWELFEEIWDKFVATATDRESNGDMSDILCAALQLFSKEMKTKDAFDGLRKLKLSKDVKDNGKAADSRAKGNALFHPKVKRYIEAVKRYNESLSFSEKGSEARALAYANRSAVCYELHRYKECLDNIRLARESNYPARLADKLNKRELAAKEALNDGVNEESTKNGEPVCTLTYDKNELVPQAVSCLELRKSEEYGRFVATTRDLKAGDVVIMEKPFCTLLLDVYRYTRCDFCHHERPFNLIPCEGCTVAMYCSGECMKQAFVRYHRYECSVIRDMWRIFTKIPVMALRTVTSAIASFNHDLYAMQKHLDDLDESKIDAFSMDWRKATPRDIYNTVHVLITNKEKRDPKDLAHRSFFSLIIYDLLIQRSELGLACDKDQGISAFLMELILKHLQTTPMNMHSQYFMEYQPKEEVYEIMNYASACFPLLSMINHSCAPNLTRVTLRDGRCAVVISRPIPKGGQLYDNYGQHHCLMPVRERRTKLLTQYKFICNCEACVNNYPLYSELPCIDVSRYGLIDTADIHATLVLHQPKTAAELLPKLCQYLNSIGYQYPRYESNLYAYYMYVSMDVENHPSPEYSPEDPCNLDNRQWLKLRHLERLNSEITHAEIGTGQMAEAFAERAMLSYDAGEDWWCLYNIDLVNCMTYIPLRLVEDVKKLYAYAYDRARGNFYPPLKYGCPLPLCYTVAIVAQSPLYGNHLRAGRNLSRGELVSREVPFVRLLMADNLLRCEYCLAYKPYVLIPCSCCSRVLYCSAKCNMRAFEEYHALECSCLGILRTHYSNLEHLAARLTIRAIRLFGGNLNLLLETVGQWSGRRQAPPSYNIPHGFETNQRTAYAMIYKLSTNRDRMNKRQLIMDAAKAIGIAKLLAPEMERLYGTKNDLGLQNALAELLVHHLQISRSNTLYLSRSPDDPEEVTPNSAGSKAFAAVLMSTGSIFNHSCVPNVYYLLETLGTVQFTANTDIRRESQLYINYGYVTAWSVTLGPDIDSDALAPSVWL
uniref:Protein-lysine N-methyltransferase SMYD4 n=1 Tax=Anopheles atroparvus TaxID=41427 RepID=A0A182IZ54_ANOAO